MWTIFCSIKRSWTQHFVTQFSAFLVMSLTYSAALFIALAVSNTESLLHWWGQVNKVTVYLKHGVEAEDKKRFESYVTEAELVKSLSKVDSKESSRRFKERFSKIANQKISLDKIDEFFPEFYELNLNQNLAYNSQKSALTAFVSRLKVKFPQIQDISFGQQWLQKYLSILSSFKSIAWILIALFLIASLIASSSVIKTLLFARRDEIEILEFIGASEFRIYIPQIVNVLLVSCLSFFFAIAINFTLYQQMNSPSLSMFNLSTAGQVSFISMGMITLLFTISFFCNLSYSVFTVFNLMPSRKKSMVLSEVFRK